ncbi:hypothetical protein ACI8AA_22255 [Geodermatophilus sp. SYSU D01180]
MGGGSRGRSTAGRTSTAAYQRQLAAAAARAAKEAAKEEEARRLAAMFAELLNVHRAEFDRTRHPVAPPAPEPDADAVRARHREAATAGLGLFQRAAKEAARQQADVAAEAEIAALRQQAQREQADLQARLDEWWWALSTNDPDTVLAALAEAFEDNEAAAAPLGVDGDEVALVVLAPPETVVPERMPSTTQAGNLSLRKLPKGERAQLYTEAVMGHVLVTLKEAFAVAPAVKSARVVALRSAGTDAYGRPRLDCLLAGHWTRAAFTGVQWSTAVASTIARDTAAELLVDVKAKELRPLDFTGQPGLQALLEVVDVDELTA